MFRLIKVERVCESRPGKPKHSGYPGTGGHCAGIPGVLGVESKTPGRKGEGRNKNILTREIFDLISVLLQTNTMQTHFSDNNKN